MEIAKIELRGFRSWREASLELAPGVNIICGGNGRGKTNLLEAVFLLSGLRSWRTPLRAELITHGGEAARIGAQAVSRGRDFEIDMHIPARGALGVRVNGRRLETRGALSEVVRCVLFSPEDLELVRGSPAMRRELLDRALCQLRPRYAQALQRYGRVLASKSRVLRQEDGGGRELLPEYDAQLCTLGAGLLRYRARYVRLLAEEAAKVQLELSGGTERLELGYKTVSTVGDPFAPEAELRQALAAHMAAHREAELASGRCLSGVHRDDLEISINGYAARAFASQGQARSCVLALKLAERELFRQDMGEYPLLLLDDVLSELDASRQAYIAGHTPGGQTVITCCELNAGFAPDKVIEI
ncbi:MAG: DNA replication/repair protein RecF [Clostridia bacterium]|nr:DNA replication/repair protein RecF [Clostridia bacterium]